MDIRPFLYPNDGICLGSNTSPHQPHQSHCTPLRGSWSPRSACELRQNARITKSLKKLCQPAKSTSTLFLLSSYSHHPPPTPPIAGNTSDNGIKPLQ